MKRNTWILLGVGAALAGASLYWVLKPEKKGPDWRQAKVERGPLRQRISATGTLSALIQVTIGSQVSGTIAAISADYNSQVKKGQVIAQIDPTLLQAQMQDAQAGLERAKTSLDDAKRQMDRAKRLSEEKLLSDQDLEARQVAYQTGLANLETAQAAVKRAKANLGYATIVAPVSGVVVSRNVDVGQTVAASFSTPTLFTIAQDLEKMKLEASIDEADIGQVKEGQVGFFTVDSYPDTQFRGKVSQVRLEPITQQNVVTYKVVMEMSNEDLKLRPGMTANVTIQTQAKDDVLKVPSSALRFNPLAFLPAGDKDKSGKTGNGPQSGSASGRPGGGFGAKGMVSRREDRIWILKDGKPVALPVKAGISDGQFTEVSGEGLNEGMQILVGIEDVKRGAATSASPLGAPSGPGGPPRR
jgi:HlyD family secretion protein